MVQAQLSYIRARRDWHYRRQSCFAVLFTWLYALLILIAFLIID
jgi:hypothetical protein